MIRTWLCASLLAISAVPVAATCAADEVRTFVQANPPTAKDALRLALRNAGLPLPRGGSCEGVDTTGIENPTIGDYLSGFLAELPPASGVSGVVASCAGTLSDLACEITIQRQSAEDVWSWGLRFNADGITGDIRPESLFCIGAG